MAQIRIPWIDAPEQLPPTHTALQDPPGLLAASEQIDASWLMASYPKGVFPWYSPGEPVLWWSTNPRAVLFLDHFKLHRSLRKTIQKIAADKHHEIRLNFDFEGTMRACASQTRRGQNSTWITEEIIAAYLDLHVKGHAHSIEHWLDDQLIGGLYCVAFGGMVYGESMFSKSTDASKIAFAYFIAWLKEQNVRIIDCQQATSHLMSLGACTLDRALFEVEMANALLKAPLNWQPCTLTWKNDQT